MGSGQVQPERELVRREPEPPGRDRDVQLRLCRDHHPGAQPGTRRRHGDALAREHLRLSDGGWPGLRGRRAGQVLPVRQPQLRPRRRKRRLPGRGRRRVRADAEARRSCTSSTTRRRTASASPPTRATRPRTSGSRSSASRRGIRRRRTTKPDEQGEAVRRGRPVPRRPHRRERRPGDQGQGQGPGAERRRREALHARRLHDAADDRRGGRRRTRATPSSRSPASRPTSSQSQAAEDFITAFQPRWATSPSTRTPSTAGRRLR